MDIQEIQEFLPHRYPFLLVDKVVECDPGERLLALKNVTYNEPYFTGHFPHQAIMPGVLIMEALAQTTALLTAKSSLGKSLHALSVRGARLSLSALGGGPHQPVMWEARPP